MNKPTAIALLVVGVLLLAYGVSASDSLASGVSETVTGAPTDRALWLIVLGLALGIVGGFGVLRRA